MKLKIIGSCLLLLIMSSCGSKKNVRNKKDAGVVITESKPFALPSVNEVAITKKLARKNPKLRKKTLAYIQKYAAIAVREMHAYKIPASITLAQGILESGSGGSELALKSNNHFGIKCHTGWTGQRVYHDDDAKGECFRKYVYTETSYRDHSLFLTQRRRYAFLFEYETKDYKKWAYGLRKAGYATDKKYPEKLLKFIKQYELYKFDKVEEADFNKKIKKLNKKSSKKRKKRGRYYKVRKGDTLYAISKRFKVSIEVLKASNNLRDNTISIGERLFIERK
ncbi:MAG: glucosaminidase domain-containing protein [Polaribacter sp.]|uniref:glucosaminidase domain-containing protein n=1 Tax=Polaribacter sp. TaxID=1920175 RepID=UPI003850341A